MNSFRLVFPLTLFFLNSSLVYGAAQCPGNVAPVQYHSLPRSHIGVSTVVNGSGPYEFMLDTGAQITVIDPVLAQQLKLESAGSLNIVTVASNVEVSLVSAIIQVGPISVRDIQLAVEDLGPIQAESPHLRGILGNNFLSRFDLLIDNRQRTLCFDDARLLQQSLRGEHLPILFAATSSPGSGSAAAILVSAHLPDDNKAGSVLRLDSGSNVPVLYVDPQSRSTTRSQPSPVRGCTIGKDAQFAYVRTPERNVRFGSQKEMQIAFATPAGASHLYAKTGEDGVLPTALFHRVFISAADHFVMFDPH